MMSLCLDSSTADYVWHTLHLLCVWDLGTVSALCAFVTLVLGD